MSMPAGGPVSVPMEVARRTVGTTPVISLAGEFDARTAPAALEHLIRLLPADGRVLLDLSTVTYMSSAGLRTLLMTYRRATGSGVDIALVGLSPQLHSMLAATGFLRFFQVAADVADGISLLGPVRPAAVAEPGKDNP